jgi:hypothetical protein
MLFAQFYQLSTGYVPGSVPPRFDDAYKMPIEACGDRAVIVLDARHSNATNDNIARNECEKRGYIGYQIFRGETFTSSRAVSCLRRVDQTRT